MSIKNLPFILYFLALFAYHIGLFGEAEVSRSSMDGAQRHFDALFVSDANGAYVVQQPIQIGGVRLGPGATIGANVELAGIRLGDLEGQEIEVMQQEGRLVLLVDLDR
ncbi:hypothetical protein [Aliagarivorans marinus]|uniref:hypothetical protein n=1 Tax=Aliagarivorans marinus TaxID=561965 RepID=UPI00040F53EF|nr:hypothetical protein [Aliagarivorans marinus]